jgi:hypothetical protein
MKEQIIKQILELKQQVQTEKTKLQIQRLQQMLDEEAEV